MTAREKAPEDRLSAYLREDAILDLSPSSKEALLRALAAAVVEDASPETVSAIYAAVVERESAVNTYVGEGVAIPHARIDSVDDIRLALARNPAGFPYGMETDQPVRLVVLVVGPEAETDEHVRVLGLIANAFKSEELRRKVLQAPDVGGVMRALDAPGRAAPRRKARPLSQLLLSYTRRIGREMGIHACIVLLEQAEDLALLKRLPGRKSLIVATSSHRVHEEAEKLVEHAIQLPQMPFRREARQRLAALLALTKGIIQRGDVVSFVSGDAAGGLDSMTILEVGRELGRFVAASGEMAPGVEPGVLERVISIASELSSEGREGRPVGTIFVVGDVEALGPSCQQMIMNPFRGYPEEERNILDPTLKETIKELAAIDGAFVVRGDGVVWSAGTYLKVSRDVDLPGGYGSRHRIACAITDAVSCVAVALSQSTGEVTVFKKGAVVVSLARAGGR